MAIKAKFFPSAGLLSETGDDVDNTIVTSRDAAGQILVNGGAVPVDGGQATVANTATIQVFGKGGNDTISLDESKWRAARRPAVRRRWQRRADRRLGRRSAVRRCRQRHPLRQRR
jgi:hypothetical protein